MRRCLLLCALSIAPVAAHAQPAVPIQPIVLELFTSQSCSSCPPADALLTELARQWDLLALDLHVDYWNRLGWRDPYSSTEFTERQRRYAALMGSSEVYTPELVVAGSRGVVGSDRAAVMAAIASARGLSQVPISFGRDGSNLVAHVGAGPGAATLWLVGFDPSHDTGVGGGENGGRTLTESNVVRSLAQAAAWSGAPMRTVLPPPPGERSAIFLQRADGRIVGAAQLPLR